MKNMKSAHFTGAFPENAKMPTCHDEKESGCHLVSGAARCCYLRAAQQYGMMLKLLYKRGAYALFIQAYYIAGIALRPEAGASRRAICYLGHASIIYFKSRKACRLMRMSMMMMMQPTMPP